MTDSTGYEAIKLFARAKVEHAHGRADRAIELLNEILVLGTRNEALRGEYPYRAAHMALHEIHHELGHHEEALEYYLKALELGETTAQLSPRKSKEVG